MRELPSHRQPRAMGTGRAGVRSQPCFEQDRSIPRTLLWAVQLAPHAKTHAGLQQSCDMDDAIFVWRIQDKLTYRKISELLGISPARCTQRYERRLRTVYRFLATFGKARPLFPLVSVTREEAERISVFTDLLLEGQVLP